MSDRVFDNRKRAHYKGDVTEGFVGLIMGPNTTNEYLVCAEATYDVVTDVTTAVFRYATQPEMESRFIDANGNIGTLE